MWRLDEDSRAVTSVGFAAASASMIQVLQHLQRLLDDRMGLPPLNVHHEPHAAGFMFELRVVKALRCRGTHPHRPATFALRPGLFRHCFWGHSLPRTE